MSRIQTRISDFGASEVRRPTVTDPRGDWQCEFQLQGTTAPNAPSEKLPILRQTTRASQAMPVSQVPVCQVIAGSLFECQYRLFCGEDASSYLNHDLKAAKLPKESGLSRSVTSDPGEEIGVLPADDPIRVVEHSVLWQTTGKGDRDFGIHLFERRKINVAKDGRVDATPGIQTPAVFKTVSPLAPLSYHGQLISIEWLVRVRVFLQSGRQLHFEQPFLLVLDPA